MKTTQQKLWKLGKGYAPVFQKHGGNLFRTGLKESRQAIAKTARELDLTKAHVLAALETYQWDI